MPRPVITELVEEIKLRVVGEHENRCEQKRRNPNRDLKLPEKPFGIVGAIGSRGQGDASDRDPDEEHGEHRSKGIGVARQDEREEPCPNDLEADGGETGYGEGRDGPWPRASAVAVHNRGLDVLRLGLGRFHEKARGDGSQADEGVERGGDFCRCLHAPCRDGVEARRETPASGAERIDGVERSRAETDGTLAAHGLLHEQGKACAHERRRRQQHDERQEDFDEALAVHREPELSQESQKEAFARGERHVEHERVEADADLERAEPAQWMPDFGEIACREGRAEAEAGHEGRQKRADREGGRAENSGQKADPDDLIDEPGGAREKEQAQDE